MCLLLFPPQFSLHIKAMVPAPRRKNEVYQTCACGISSTSGKVSSHLSQRKQRTPTFAKPVLGQKNPLEETVWEIGLDPSNRWAIGKEFMAVIQYENLRCSEKKRHLTQRLMIALTLCYSLWMVQTAMIVMRHIKGFAVHCHCFPVTRQSVCRSIHKFHQILALNQNGKQRMGNFNACISDSNTPTRI